VAVARLQGEREDRVEAGGPLVAADVAETDDPAVVHDRQHELRRHGHVPAPDLVLDRDGERARGDGGRGLDPA